MWRECLTAYSAWNNYVHIQFTLLILPQMMMCTYIMIPAINILTNMYRHTDGSFFLQARNSVTAGHKIVLVPL